MKRRVTVSIMCMGLALSACDSAKVETTREIMNYVETNYGKARLVAQQMSGPDEVVYYFEDDEYKFTYSIISSITPQTTTSNKLTYYNTKERDSDFEPQYFSAVSERIQSKLNELATNYDIRVDTTGFEDDSKRTMTEVAIVTMKNYNTEEYGDKLQQAVEVAKQVSSLFAEEDKRGILYNTDVKVNDKNDNTVGYWNGNKGCWVNEADSATEYFKSLVEMYIPDAILVDIEEKRLADTDIPRDKISSVKDDMGITDDTVVTFYYFQIGTNIYYIADVVVTGEDSTPEWYMNIPLHSYETDDTTEQN